MAKPEDILHDLLDNLEDVSGEARSRLRQFIAALDPVRLADPADAAYDVFVRDGLAEIISGVQSESHSTGTRTGERLAGIPTGSASRFAGALLQQESNVILARLDGSIVRLGAQLDEFLAISQARGTDPRVVLDTLERSLRAIGDPNVTGANPTLTVELRTVYGEILEDAVQGSSRAGQVEVAADQAGVDPDLMPMQWICALVNTCHDCLARHSQTRTFGEWTSAGLPGSGWSVCGGYCRCQLVPEEVVGDEMQPLVRVRETVSGLTVRAPSALFSAEPRSAERRTMREDALREARENDIRVRRAYRLLGRQNEGT